ncbi:hypothetical protein HDU98_009205 [Podochytrium sp. JEL0797]|nr:hypothetical protein HDU98_009205 [Podochytrium sp. JEL0797]
MVIWSKPPPVAIKAIPYILYTAIVGSSVYFCIRFAPGMAANHKPASLPLAADFALLFGWMAVTGIALAILGLHTPPGITGEPWRVRFWESHRDAHRHFMEYHIVQSQMVVVSVSFAGLAMGVILFSQVAGQDAFAVAVIPNIFISVFVVMGLSLSCAFWIGPSKKEVMAAGVNRLVLEEYGLPGPIQAQGPYYV